MKYETRLTENFKLSEFLYSRFYDDVSQQRVLEEFERNKEWLLPNIIELAENLQILSDYICFPILINIGYRPIFWEIMQGRTGNSSHVLGKAADFYIEEVSTNDIGEAIEFLIEQGSMTEGGLGVYSNFVHYDNRKVKKRW